MLNLLKAVVLAAAAACLLAVVLALSVIPLKLVRGQRSSLSRLGAAVVDRCEEAYGKWETRKSVRRSVQPTWNHVKLASDEHGGLSFVLSSPSSKSLPSGR